VPGANGVGTSGTNACALVLPDVMLACEWHVVQSTCAKSFRVTWQLEHENVTVPPP
jgi:hypothetical protein